MSFSSISNQDKIAFYEEVVRVGEELLNQPLDFYDTLTDEELDCCTQVIKYALPIFRESNRPLEEETAWKLKMRKVRELEISDFTSIHALYEKFLQFNRSPANAFSVLTSTENPKQTHGFVNTKNDSGDSLFQKYLKDFKTLTQLLKEKTENGTKPVFSRSGYNPFKKVVKSVDTYSMTQLYAEDPRFQQLFDYRTLEDLQLNGESEVDFDFYAKCVAGIELRLFCANLANALGLPLPKFDKRDLTQIAKGRKQSLAWMKEHDKAIKEDIKALSLYKMTYVPKLDSCLSLETLILSQCGSIEFFQSIKALPKLKKLSLVDNDFKVIPANIAEKLPNLEELFISQPIDSLDFIADLPNLRAVELGENLELRKLLSSEAIESLKECKNLRFVNSFSRFMASDQDKSEYPTYLRKISSPDNLFARNTIEVTLEEMLFLEEFKQLANKHKILLEHSQRLERVLFSLVEEFRSSLKRDFLVSHSEKLEQLIPPNFESCEELIEFMRDEAKATEIMKLQLAFDVSLTMPKIGEQ